MLHGQVLRRTAGAGLACVASAAYVVSEYRDWAALFEDARVAERDLPSTAVAQRSRVVAVPGALSPEDIAGVEAFHGRHGRSLGTSGRTEGNGSAAFKTGRWETSFLHTSGLARKEIGATLEALKAHVVAADALSGAPLLAANGGPIPAEALVPRTVERHVVLPGGSLNYPTHHDAGSVYTIDVLLCDPADYGGGVLSTLEADGGHEAHAFAKAGDGFVFQSHKFHSVSPVTRGERRVLVVEYWIGEERTCAHRCERHWGPCGHTAAHSFWRRALANVADDSLGS